MLSEEIFRHPLGVWVVLRQMCPLPDFPTCTARQPGLSGGRTWPLGTFLGASDTLTALRDGCSAVNLFWSLWQLLCFIFVAMPSLAIGSASSHLLINLFQNHEFLLPTLHSF